MDFAGTITIVQESLYLILVFTACLAYGLVRGRQSLINLILALYLGLLISLEFPYHDKVLAQAGSASSSIVMIVMFAVFTAGAVLLFERLMPRDPLESAFEAFGKKLALALLAAILIMAYSYHALPITDLITPGSPIQTLFGSENYFFWWLLVPLVGLLFL